jgi:hypothetical protein
MIYDKNNETHEKYIHSLKMLDKANKYSEHRKVPETPEEISFMKETYQATHTNSFALNIPENRWEAIFCDENILFPIGESTK